MSQSATVFRMSGRPRAVPARRFLTIWLVILVLGSGIAWALSGEWITAAALWVLAAGWRYLRTEDGPPVLALAFTFQWVQVTVGVYYHALTGSRLDVMDLSDYRPMVLIGLGCLLALLLGLTVGMRLIGRSSPKGKEALIPALGWRTLILLYLTSIALTGTVQQFAWQFPALTQGVLALTYGRFALLFLIFHRLSQPRVRGGWIAVLLAGEIALGFTGYFAGFKEPLMVAAIALTGVFDRRRTAHWITLVILGVVMVLAGTLWMGIRTEYRADFESEVFAESREARLGRTAQLSAELLQGDFGELVSNVESLVDRLWAVYYPALAVSRVPSVLPHENGAILVSAVRHALTPRFFFPEKSELPSDSEKVREYSGVWVAGTEEGTSIAFGYAAESYVDFGVPLMFLPVAIYGLLMGMAFQWWLRVIRSRELAVALVVIVFWLSLYLFERSWAKTLGGAGTLMIYLGGAVYLIDRLMARRGRFR
jgi:hypothetical protein